MSTPDRTTIPVAIAALVDGLRGNLVAEPPTPTMPFRRVEIGASGVEEYARPFLAVRLVRARPVSVIRDDKVIEVSLTVRIVLDVLEADAHEELLGAIGAVEDYFDGLLDTALVEGADGLDERSWSVEYPRTTSGARVITAEASQTLAVRIERGQNRVPAV